MHGEKETMLALGNNQVLEVLGAMDGELLSLASRQGHKYIFGKISEAERTFLNWKILGQRRLVRCGSAVWVDR